MSDAIARVEGQLRAMNLKQLDLVKKEYESMLPNPASHYKTRNDLIAALATIMVRENPQEQDGPDVASQLPVVFNQFLDKRTKLSAIRTSVMEMFKNPFFAAQKEFEESLKFLDRLEPQFKDNHCRILVIGNNSSGKSLFLNLLLGAEVLPFTALPCTSVICEIQRSEEKRFTVKDFNGNVVVDQSLDVPGQKPRDILQPYIFTQGVERNAQGKYKSVHIFWPTPILGPGIVLVDSPGLEENDTMTQVVDNYIDSATALICVIDSTQGAITDSLRRTLKRVSLDMSEKKETEMQTSIHREAVLFVCNKWDLVTVGQQKEVFDNIVDHAKKFWSADVTENQFLKMNTEAAFIARVQQGRDNGDAKNLKSALNSFLEKAFHFKLHNLWFNINLVCLRGARVGRSRWNMINRSENERQQIVKDAKIRLDKLYAHAQDEVALKKLLEDYNKHFLAAKKELGNFLGSSDIKELVEKWSGTLKISSSDYPKNFDAAFDIFLEKLVEEWELKHKHFKTAEILSMKQLASLVYMAESERKLVESLIAGDSQDAPVDTSSQLSTGQKVLIGVTSPIWIPLAVVAAPVFLIMFAVKFFKEKSVENKKAAFENQRQEMYQKDAKRQIATDVQQLLQVLPSLVDFLTSKMFMSTENFVKKVFTDLALRIAYDMRQIEFIEKDEKNQALMKQVLESAMQITDVVVGAVRNYYIENLRKDSIDKSKIHLTKQIGSGAFSKVYEGTYDQAPVAIKVLITSDTATINAFFQEEEVLMSLKHSSILQFHGSYIESRPTGDKEFYIVTALAEGDLRGHLRSSRVRSERLKMIKDLASAIEFMHQNGYIHRDLKPENILIKGGQVKVADLGLTRKSFDITGTLAGTPLYMAPEILRHEYDDKVDVYSFGRIIWEIWFLESCERYFPRSVDLITVISTGFDLPKSLSGREEPPSELANLFSLCCKHSKHERPNFETICTMLKTIN